MAKPAQGWRVRIWPWLVLALATLPAVWYVVDFESDIDPEFPRVVRPTFNTYPPPAYRFAEAGRHDRSHRHLRGLGGHRALGMGPFPGHAERVSGSRRWRLSLAGFWHAATPGPLLDGWHGLGWRTMLEPGSRPGQPV